MNENGNNDIIINRSKINFEVAQEQIPDINIELKEQQIEFPNSQTIRNQKRVSKLETMTPVLIKQKTIKKMKKGEKPETFLDKLREKIYNLESKLPYILDLFRDQIRSRPLFVLITGLFFTFLVLLLFPTIIIKDSEVNKLEVKLNTPSRLLIGTNFGNSSSYYITAIDQYGTILPDKQISLYIEDIRNNNSLALDCSRQTMYKRIFTLEALRYRDICKVYFSGSNIINTGPIGIGRVNSTTVFSGPNGNYEVSHNYYTNEYSTYSNLFEEDINKRKNRKYPSFSALMDDYIYRVAQGKISTMNNYFVYHRSRVKRIVVENFPPKTAEIGKPLSVQPIVIVKDNKGRGVSGKKVIAFSWFYHGYEFDDLYYLKANKFAYLENTVSMPTDINGRVVFENLKIIGSNYKYAYILFYCDGVVETWHWDAQVNSMLLEENSYSPAIELITPVAKINVDTSLNIDITEGAYLEPGTAPVVTVLDKEGKPVKNKMVFVELLGNSFHNYSAGFIPDRDDKLYKDIYFPIKGNYSFSVFDNLYSDQKVFSDPVLTDNEGKIVMDQFIFNQHGDSLKKNKVAENYTYYVTFICDGVQWEKEIAFNLHPPEDRNFIAQISQNSTNLATGGGKFSTRLTFYGFFGSYPKPVLSDSNNVTMDALIINDYTQSNNIDYSIGIFQINSRIAYFNNPNPKATYFLKYYFDYCLPKCTKDEPKKFSISLSSNVNQLFSACNYIIANSSKINVFLGESFEIFGKLVNVLGKPIQDKNIKVYLKTFNMFTNHFYNKYVSKIKQNGETFISATVNPQTGEFTFPDIQITYSPKGTILLYVDTVVSSLKISTICSSSYLAINLNSNTFNTKLITENGKRYVLDENPAGSSYVTGSYVLQDKNRNPLPNKRVYISFEYYDFPFFTLAVEDFYQENNFLVLNDNWLTYDVNGVLNVKLLISESIVGYWGIVICIDGIISNNLHFSYMVKEKFTINILRQPSPSFIFSNQTTLNDIKNSMINFPSTFEVNPQVEILYKGAPLKDFYVLAILVDDIETNKKFGFSDYDASINFHINQIKGVDADSLKTNSNRFIKEPNENIFFNTELYKSDSKGRVEIPVVFRGVNNTGCYVLHFAVGISDQFQFSSKSNSFCVKNNLFLNVTNADSLQQFISAESLMTPPITISASFDYKINQNYYFSLFVFPYFENEFYLPVYESFLQDDKQLENNLCIVELKNVKVNQILYTQNDCGSFKITSISENRISLDLQLSRLQIKNNDETSMKLAIGQQFDIFDNSTGKLKSINTTNTITTYYKVQALKINTDLSLKYNDYLIQVIQFSVNAYLDSNFRLKANNYKIKCSVISDNININGGQDSLLNGGSSIEFMIAQTADNFKLVMNNHNNILTAITDKDGFASFSFQIEEGLSGWYKVVCWDNTNLAVDFSKRFYYLNYLNKFDLKIFNKDGTPYTEENDLYWATKTVGSESYEIVIDKVLSFTYYLPPEVIGNTTQVFSAFLYDQLKNDSSIIIEEAVSEIDSLRETELTCLKNMIKNRIDLTKYSNMFQPKTGINITYNYTAPKNIDSMSLGDISKYVDVNYNMTLVQDLRIISNALNTVFQNNDCNRTSESNFATIIEKIYNVIFSGLSNINDNLSMPKPSTYKANFGKIFDKNVGPVYNITNITFTVDTPGKYRIKLKLGYDYYFPYTFEVINMFQIRGINLEWFSIILLCILCFFSNVRYNSKLLFIASFSVLFLESVMHYYTSKETNWLVLGYMFIACIFVNQVYLIYIFYFKKEKTRLLYFYINEIFLEYSYQLLFKKPSDYWLDRIEKKIEDKHRLDIINTLFLDTNSKKAKKIKAENESYRRNTDKNNYHKLKDLSKSIINPENLDSSSLSKDYLLVSSRSPGKNLNTSKLSLIQVCAQAEKEWSPTKKHLQTDNNQKDVFSNIPAIQDLGFKDIVKIFKEEKDEELYNLEMDPINSHLNIDSNQKFNRVISSFYDYYDKKVVIHDCIYFPQRILTPLFLGFLSISFITYKAVQFFSNLVIYVNSIKQQIQLKVIVESINFDVTTITRSIDTNKTPIKIEIDSIFDEISTFVDIIVLGMKLGMIISAIFTYLVYTANIFLLLFDFKTRVLLLRQNRPDFDRKKAEISSALGFVGGYLANAVLSFIIVFILLGCVCGLFALVEFWQLIYETVFVTFLNVLILAIINIVILFIVKNIICGQDYVRFPRLLGYFEIYLIFSKLYTGLVSSLVRLLMLLFGVTISVFRVDQSAFPFWIYQIINLDIINNAYLGVVHMYHTHNHPCLVSFVNILHSLKDLKNLKSLSQKNEKNYLRNKLKFAKFLKLNEKIHRERKIEVIENIENIENIAEEIK